jgi:prevent-host-death family protein
MHISVTDAKGKLTDLVRRAEAGDEVILTRHGEATVQLMPVKRKLPSAELRARRLAVLDEIIAAARSRGPEGGPPAARAADFLYGDDGLPA